MDPLFLAVGASLLVAVIVDLLWTTLWVDEGAGPLSSRLMAGTWRGLRAVSGDRPRVLSLAGPLLIMLTFAMWIGLLWAGWMFVFAGSEAALVDTHNRGPIDWFDRIYFVAYVLFTLGVGDILPRDGTWQIVTVLTTATGMLFITMSVSYVISVLGAVSRKRSFASGVTALGATGEAFVRKGWTGEDFRGFELVLSSLADEASYLSYQYKAYPILHYYHTRDARASSAVAAAVFDEALTLLRFGVAPDSRPNEALVDNARASTENYVGSLSSGLVESAESTPPSPTLDGFRAAGIPTVDDGEFATAVETLAEHRAQLLAVVETDARQWPTSGE